MASRCADLASNLSNRTSSCVSLSLLVWLDLRRFNRRESRLEPVDDAGWLGSIENVADGVTLAILCRQIRPRGNKRLHRSHRRHLHGPVHGGLSIGVARVDLLGIQVGQEHLQKLDLVPTGKLVQRREAVGIRAGRVDLRRVGQVRTDLLHVSGEVHGLGQRSAAIRPLRASAAGRSPRGGALAGAKHGLHRGG
eukprot:scaffold1876_cov257-Pinguiococcus_pyrenoidosus.AAC.1